MNNNTTQSEDEKRYLSSGFKIGNAAATSGMVGYGLYRTGRYDRVKLAAKLSKALRKKKNTPSTSTINPRKVAEKLGVKNTDSALGKSIQRTVKYAPGLGKNILTGIGRLAEASHWTRKNWKHGGILGKGKVLAVGSILPGAVGIKQAALRQYYDNKDKGEVHEYQEFTPDQEELVRGRKFTQGHDAKRKAIAGGVVGTGLGAAGIYGASKISKLPAESLKFVNLLSREIEDASVSVIKNPEKHNLIENTIAPTGKVLGMAGKTATPGWLIKLAERKPKLALHLQQFITGIDARKLKKIAKIGSKMNAKWNRGLGGKTIVAGTAMIPGAVLGGGSYAASKVMNSNTGQDYSKNKRHIIDLNNIESSSGSETARLRGSILGFRSNNIINATAGQVSGVLGGRRGAKAANKADLEGKNDESILRTATRSGRLGGAVSGAVLGTAAGALWAREHYRFDLSKLKNVAENGFYGYASARNLTRAVPIGDPARIGAGVVRGAKNALRAGETSGFVLPGFKDQAVKDAAIRGGIATAIAGGLAGDRAAYNNTKARLDARRNTEENIANGKVNAISYKAEARRKRLEKEEGKKPIGKSILAGLGAAGATGLGMSILSDYSENQDFLDKLERTYQKSRDSKVGNWLFGKDRAQQLENRIEDASEWIYKNWKKPGIAGKVKVVRIPLGVGAAAGTTYYINKRHKDKKDLEYYRNLEKHYDNIKNKNI